MPFLRLSFIISFTSKEKDRIMCACRLCSRSAVNESGRKGEASVSARESEARDGLCNASVFGWFFFRKRL